MNARMKSTEYDSTRRLRKLRNAQAEKAQKEFERTKKTGFLKIGNGKVIHIGEINTLCGVEGVGSAQINFSISPLKIIDGPATCKRCLKIKSQ